MNIYRYTFPIHSEYTDEVFFKHVYFEGSRCPTHEEVVKRLEHLAKNEENSYPQNSSEFKQCLEAVNGSLQYLPRLHQYAIEASYLTNLKKLGRQPITVKLIEPEYAWEIY